MNSQRASSFKMRSCTFRLGGGGASSSSVGQVSVCDVCAVSLSFDDCCAEAFCWALFPRAACKALSLRADADDAGDPGDDTVGDGNGADASSDHDGPEGDDRGEYPAIPYPGICLYSLSNAAFVGRLSQCLAPYCSYSYYHFI